MRVIEVSKYGDPEVLRVVDRPEPVAGDGKIRVRVTAAPVNPADAWTRKGAMAERTPNAQLPIVLGWDFAGEVLDPADGFAAGQAVVGLYPWFELGDGTGTNAEVILVKPEWLVALPAGADPVEASTLALNALTALHALRIVTPKPGQTLVITGASGGVGGFAVQLAAAAGAHVIAVASTGDEDYIKSLGAAEVLGRTSNEDLVGVIRKQYPDGVDAALDASAGGPVLIGAVRDGGAYAATTDPVQPEPERGIEPGTVHVTPDATGLADLIKAWSAGTLRTRVADTIPFADAVAAHQRLDAGSLRGKLVLIP